MVFQSEVAAMVHGFGPSKGSRRMPTSAPELDLATHFSLLISF
jgi:hypothetical protein